MDLTAPWVADYQHMFADNEDEEEDVVAGGLSEFAGTISRSISQCSVAPSSSPKEGQ